MILAGGDGTLWNDLLQVAEARYNNRMSAAPDFALQTCHRDVGQRLDADAGLHFCRARFSQPDTLIPVSSIRSGDTISPIHVRWQMKFLRIPVVVLIILILISCTDYAPQKDQTIGESIIAAITAYKSDHNAYPATLDNLIPKYIETIPLTSSGDKFHYFLSPGDGGYSLCFNTSSKKRSGCCYLPRFDLWDCTEGD